MTTVLASKEHIYLHQSVDGEVSPDDLAKDVAEYPEDYPKELMPHIEAHLAKAGVGETVNTSKSIDEIYAILNGQKDGTLTNEDAQQLIQADMGYDVVRNIDKFHGLDHNAIAQQLIERGEGSAVVYHLDKFHGLDNDTAQQLIKDDWGDYVADNLDKFHGLDHNDIAQQLIQLGLGGAVANNLDKFHGLDHNAIAQQLIQAGYGNAVANNLDKFHGLDHNAIAQQLIQAGRGDVVANNLDKFHGLDQVTIDGLIDTGRIIDVIQFSDKFDVDIGSILTTKLSKITESEDVADAVVENIALMNLTKADAQLILKACCAHYSSAHKVLKLDLDSIVGENVAGEIKAHVATLKPELRGVKNVNPYREESGDMEHITATQPGQEIHQKAVEINRALRDGDERYKELAERVEQAYSLLYASLAHEHDIEYAERLFGVQGKFGDMWPTYRRLVADYVALGGEENEISTALERANTAFLQVLRVDTKYYDKLFTEWDAKRLGQREFQEVFLGRDGVYAYVGRKAQMAARRLRLGVKDNADSQLEAPSYLVYPRGFRDGLNKEVKTTYLHQEIKNLDAAYYYDTGFTGTIPEDIMRVLGVSEKEWEKHIRLLSASKRDRTVLGLEGSKTERDEVVNTVEYHVKDEETAEGLYWIGEGDDRRLAPYATPTSPAERLAFRFTQMALSRHYFTQEMADKSERVERLDTHSFGTREMRINNRRSDEATTTVLKDIFSSENIGGKLLSQAKALKLANPEDPYPDEAVFELSTPKGDMVVKAVVGDKQKGPIDEFEALLLLERLGIEAPRSIARVFTEGQKGFVVMEKLGGTSGRTIKKYFEDHAVEEVNQREILDDALVRMKEIAEVVRRDTGLDKPWRLKDFMLEYETVNGKTQIKSMKPIDFERAKVFNPEDPHSIKLGQDMDY